jgi:type VI secretion system protein ImpE
MLYREGKLGAAIESLQGHLREDPTSRKARTFLFELLLFAGEFDRAGRQLAALAEESKESRFGHVFYEAALRAEKERHEFYRSAVSQSGETQTSEVGGRRDGQPFRRISDIDPRLGPALEFLTAGNYYRIPFRHLKWLELEPPRSVRDLYWLPARAGTVPSVQIPELESILVPVLYPESSRVEDDETRLGRMTVWTQAEDGAELPCGQRLLMLDEEEVPILSIRRIEFDNDPTGSGAGDG